MPDPMTDERLAEIEAQWADLHDKDGNEYLMDAIEQIPKLLAEVKRLREELTNVKEEFRVYCQDYD